MRRSSSDNNDSVTFLDWSGVDLVLDPLHSASKLFYSKSSLEL